MIAIEGSVIAIEIWDWDWKAERERERKEGGRKLVFESERENENESDLPSDPRPLHHQIKFRRKLLYDSIRFFYDHDIKKKSR